ncbi:hypothetical protein H8S95_00565 [Pontibacter sp. KCTC 32443]|uniref:hypothetical protein n=1 Tax=Pontibacter TaxID=323449 RepID=UPI00164DEA66|nr:MULTISPECIES: hypothetical protein [Pontibacter]MBC5772541.1 hypothetical protein [Pontibacter sp. KCTC 32443]
MAVSVVPYYMRLERCKKTTAMLAIVVVIMGSCGPENKKVTDEQIETGGRTEVLDSIANTREDGVQIDDPTIPPALTLPPPATQVLDKRYPGWQQPVLSQSAEKSAEVYEQGPTIITGNFNQDTIPDYALQLQQDKDIVMIALLQDSARNWKTYELKRDVLFNERGKLQSLYILHLLARGAELQDETDTSKKIKAPYDAVAISTESNTTAYVLEDEAFKSYATAEE